MKSLYYAGALLIFSGVTLLADGTAVLPLSSVTPKPVPLIVLIDGSEASNYAVPVEKAAPGAALEPKIALVQPAGVETETNTAAVEAKKHSSTINKVFAISIGALLGGTAMDAVSSWGKSEANPLLRSANGTFGMRGLAIKGGLAGAMVAPELLMHPDDATKKKLAIVNLVGASVFSAVVLHNLSIPKVPVP
jgi:hypothetical protein